MKRSTTHVIAGFMDFLAPERVKGVRTIQVVPQKGNNSQLPVKVEIREGKLSVTHFAAKRVDSVPSPSYEANALVEFEIHLIEKWGRRTCVFSPETLRLGPTSELTFMLPSDAEIEVTDRLGRAWTITTLENRMETAVAVREKSTIIYGTLKALTVHLMIAAAAWYAFRTNEIGFNRIDEKNLKDQMKLASVISSTTTSAVNHARPFSGLTLRELEIKLAGLAAEQKLVRATPKEKIGSLGKLLSGGAFKKSGSSMTQPTLPSGPLNGGNELIATAMSKAKPAHARPLSVSKPIPLTETAIPVNRELQVRHKMENIKPLLVKAYDEALRLEPSLSVTISYEATVGDKGYLRNIKLTSNGSGSPKAVAVLSDKVKSALESYSIGDGFSGLVFRGEQAFIR